MPLTTIILNTSEIPDAPYRLWVFTLIDSHHEEVLRRDIYESEVLEKAKDRVTLDLQEDVLERSIRRALIWPVLTDGTLLMKKEYIVAYDPVTSVISPIVGDASRFDRYVMSYANQGWCNDAMHIECTLLCEQYDALRQHRHDVETHNLGFGDRAFHGMWLVLCEHLSRRQRVLSFLEIGVFKGQVLSLWSLLSRELGFEADITGISPFQGGSIYPEEDYEAAVREHFGAHCLPMDRVRLLKGLSTDAEIIQLAGEQRYDVVYIDGDHSLECVMSDVKHYGQMLTADGYLVLDDASAFLEGSRFWKGYESVSRVAECLPGRGFDNLLNVGHNRLYRPRPSGPSQCRPR